MKTTSTFTSSVILLFSFTALAETATIEVGGMHCSSCKKMIQSKVCDDAAMKPDFESCTVKLTDTKKELGQIQIVTKADHKVDEQKIEAAVKAAGESYKIKKIERK